MQAIATDVAHCMICIWLLGTLVIPAKTAESVEMPFEEQIHVDPRNHHLVLAPPGKCDGIMCAALTTMQTVITITVATVIFTRLWQEGSYVVY